MALVKAVPDDAVMVEITDVVDAGTFWAKSNTPLSEKWSKPGVPVEAMEMFLTKAKLTAAPKRQPPGFKELVAVNNREIGTWHRGRIEALPRFDVENYEVFLIDHGRTIEVPSSAIRDIDECYTKQEPLAFMIELVGIVPTKPPAFNTCRENLTWSFEASMFVRYQIAKSSIGYFCKKTENAMKDVKHGKLFLVAEDGFVDLGLLLCLQNYAISCDATVKAKKKYSYSNEKDCVTFQEKLGRKKGKYFQNPNYPIGKEFMRRMGVNTQEEKKSAIKAVTEMCAGLELQESLQTDTRVGNVDKFLKTRHEPYNCNEVLNLSKIQVVQKCEEEEEEEEEDDSMSNSRKPSWKELQRISMEENVFSWTQSKGFTERDIDEISRPAHSDIKGKLSQKTLRTKGYYDPHAQKHCQEKKKSTLKAMTEMYASLELQESFLTDTRTGNIDKLLKTRHEAYKCNNVLNLSKIQVVQKCEEEEEEEEEEDDSMSNSPKPSWKELQRVSMEENEFSWTQSKGFIESDIDKISRPSYSNIKGKLNSQMTLRTKGYYDPHAQEHCQENISYTDNDSCGDKETLDETAIYYERISRKKPTFPYQNHRNRTQTKSVESSRRYDGSHDYNKEKLSHDQDDLTFGDKMIDKDPTCSVTHSERDVRQKSFSVDTNFGSKNSGDCSEQFKLQGHHKQNKSSQLYYLRDHKKFEDISRGIKFDGRNVGKTNFSFDRATENIYETSSVDSSTRSITQHLSDQCKSNKANKYGSSFVTNPVCGEDVDCDEKNVIKTFISPHNDCGNRNYLKNSNFSRKCDVPMESHEFSRRHNFFAEHDLSQDIEKSYKGSFMKKHISENDLRNKIKIKESFDSHKYSEKHGSSRDNEMFDENSSNCARVYKRDVETPFVLPHDNPKFVTSSKRCNIYETPESELKKNLEKFSTHAQCGEDFDSAWTSGKKLSVKGKVKSTPIRTFFPAGFNMDEADMLFAKTKQKLSSNSANQVNSFEGCTNTGRPGHAARNTKTDSGKVIKCGEIEQQNKLETVSYGKFRKLQKHMNAELHEECSFNSDEYSKKEIEVHSPICEEIMSPPKSKRRHLMDSPCNLDYSKRSEDHESLNNFYRNHKKNSDQIEFVSDGNPQQIKLESKEQKKLPKHMNGLEGFNLNLHNEKASEVKSPTCDEVEQTYCKLVVSCEVESGESSCVSEFGEKIEEMKLEPKEELKAVEMPHEFDISSESEVSDSFEKTLHSQPNIIDKRFSPKHSGQQMQGIYNSIMSTDISFPQTCDRTEQTPLSREHRLLSAIQEYFAGTDLAQGNESNTCVPLLQQILKNLSTVSVEGSAVDTKEKGMVNKSMEDSEISNTATTDGNMIIDNVETREHIQKSTMRATSESTDTVSPVGLSDMQNELQKKACETPNNISITMLNEVSEQKLKDSVLKEGSPPAARNISEIIQVGVLTERTDSVEAYNCEVKISEDLQKQDVASVLEGILENVSERVLLKEDSETLVLEYPVAEVQEGQKLVEKKEPNHKAEEAQKMAKKRPNYVAEKSLNGVEEYQKSMKSSLKIVEEENTNFQVAKKVNGKEEDTLLKTKEVSYYVDVIESTSSGKVGEIINVDAKCIHIEVEQGSNIITEKDKIVLVDENTETMTQKSHEIKIEDSDIAEEALVEDSNNVMEESPKEENLKLIVTEGTNISVKDEIENVEDHDTATLIRKCFVTNSFDIETEVEGQNVLEAPIEDCANIVEGNPKCVTMEDMETVLKTACTELKEVVKSVPVEVSNNCDFPETKVIDKEISQTSQIYSCLGTLVESKSISKDILENHSFLPQSSLKEYETMPLTDTSRTVKENLIERAQISEEQNSTRNSIESSTDSDVTKVSEKPPPCRIIGVEPELPDNTSKKVVDQLQTMIVLLHGAPEGFRHLNAVTDAAFRMDVHEVLSSIIKRMKRIQKYVWPLILQGYSVVMVGPPISGKTLGYIVPLMDMVMQNVHCNQIPKGNGPVMLVLCSGSNNCNEIQKYFTEFIQKSSKDIKMMVAYSGGAEKIELKLVNGCHILISTPRCFKRLYGFGKVVVNFLRLKYLVLDEADALTLRFLPEIEYILKCLERDMKPQDKVQLQVVTAAEKWCPGFDELVKSLIKPVVCIGAYLEALAYAHIKPHVHYATQSNRLAIVTEIVEKSSENHRTLIFCREVDEVKTLKNVLKFYHHLLYVHDDMDAHSVQGVHDKWRRMAESVLMCTDNIFQEMPFCGASQVIHFSLGDISKREFACRCSAIIDRLPSIFENQEKKETDVQPQMHIFISDSDSEPLPTLVSWLKRLGVPVDPDLQKRANEAEFMKEMRKDCIPLCYNTKAFGDCWNKSKCMYRHVICHKDEPQNIPMSGTVKVKILYVHNACNYSARLLDHVNKNGEVKAIPNSLISLTKKLRMYFKVEEHRILLENPKVHDLCAVEKLAGMFLRTEILAITIAGKNDHLPKELLVRYIDDGDRGVVKADEVFVLPEDLKEIPPQSVELYLCRLVPCDLDWSWGTVTTKKVDSILTEANEKGKFLIGKIKLSLGHILWLDPLECFESLGMLKTSTIKFSLRRKLLDEGLAVENPQHLQLLYQACIRGGLDVSYADTSDESLPVVKFEGKEEIISWAHLPVDEFSLVYFIVGDHPGRFYVRQKKFEDLVYKLDKKLLRFVKEQGATDRTFFTGDYCIGKFPTDNRWYRARVEKAQDDTLDLFFVDHGDRASVSRSEAIPLPKNFISQLPFQAIECCLAGVGPDMGDMWSEKSLETLYGITNKPGTIDGVKLLYAKVMDKVKPADCTGGYKYHVALIDVTPHGQALLNDSLVAWEVATQTEEQKLLLANLDYSHLCPPLDLDYESDQDEDEDEQSLSLNEVKIVLEENWDHMQEVSPLSALTDVANMSGQSCSPDVSSSTETSLVPMIDFNFDFVSAKECKEFLYESNDDYLRKQSTNNVTSSSDKEENEGENKLEQTTATLLETLCCSKSESEGKCMKDGMGLEDPELLPLNTRDFSNGPRGDDLKNVMDDDCPMPCLERRTRTPLIYWHQNPYFVWLRVDLPGIEKYHLKWDTDNLHFWTVVNELIYTFDLNLFGPINPRTLKHSGGLFVRIKMQKVAVGIEWLRLVVEQKKCQWIKRDYEAEDDSDIEDLHLSEQLRAVKEMEKKTATPKHGEGLLPADEAPYEEDDDDSDSCCSDTKLPGDEQYDPFDPLN